MSLSAGGSTSQQATSSSIDPEIKNRWLQLEGRADDAYRDISGGIKSGAYDIRPDQMVAPLNPVSQAAVQRAQDVANGSIGDEAINRAIAAAGSLPSAAGLAADPRLRQTAAYRPAAEIQESLAGPASTYAGARIGPMATYAGAQTDLAQLPSLDPRTAAQGAAAYKDLYDANVVDPTIKDLFRAKEMTDAKTAAAATQAGAFGGSRHGIVDAETNRAFADAAAKESGALRQSGFSAIAGLAQSDADRALSADTTRYGAAAGILQGNTGYRQQAGLAGMEAANSRALQQAQLEQQAGLEAADARNNMAQFNAAQSQNADLANQTAENTAAWANSAAQDQASQANADRVLQALTGGGQLQLAGAQALGTLGQAQRAMAESDVNLLNGAGATLQGNAQALADARTRSIDRQMQLPMQALNAYLPVFGSAVPTTANGGTVTQNSRGKQQSIGLGG